MTVLLPSPERGGYGSSLLILASRGMAGGALIIVSYPIVGPTALRLVATWVGENDAWSDPFFQLFHIQYHFGSFCFHALFFRFVVGSPASVLGSGSAGR